MLFIDIDLNRDYDIAMTLAGIMNYNNPVYYFDNVGNAIHPNYILYELGSEYNVFNAIITPTHTTLIFCDYDKDGDLDFFVGSQYAIKFFRNDGESNKSYFREINGKDNPFNSFKTTETLGKDTNEVSKGKNRCTYRSFFDYDDNGLDDIIFQIRNFEIYDRWEQQILVLKNDISYISKEKIEKVINYHYMLKSILMVKTILLLP